MSPALFALLHTIVVQPSGPVPTLSAALALAKPGDRIVVRAGTYRELAIVVSIPVEIVGEGDAVFVGGSHHTIEVRADKVVIRGLHFAGVSPSSIEDRSAIFVAGSGCLLESNVIEDAYFGIYLKEASGCRLVGNRIRGVPSSAGTTGNGIQLWRSREVQLDSNRVSGHRDGIYLEFSPHAVVRNNDVSGNQRYGLHFMRSDSCRYERNGFTRNGAGVAVMYSRGVAMVGNRFERNWGPAAFGLLLKEITDGVVRDNWFLGNTVGLHLDASDRNLIAGNQFESNGWAVRLLASATNNRFEGNSFEGNSFDVATNSRSASSSFRGNWWDHYRGYDLDRDGYGDVPFLPVRLFSLVVEQSKPTIVLLRSAFVELLDNAERLLPILVPQQLADPRPLMRRPQ